MVGTLTYSGVTGPGQSLSSAVFNDVHSVKFNFDKEVIEVESENPSKLSTLDLRATTTITAVVVAGKTVALTVS